LREADYLASVVDAVSEAHREIEDRTEVNHDAPVPKERVMGCVT
jgi:hypothetical protein